MSKTSTSNRSGLPQIPSKGFTIAFSAALSKSRWNTLAQHSIIHTEPVSLPDSDYSSGHRTLTSFQHPRRVTLPHIDQASLPLKLKLPSAISTSTSTSSPSKNANALPRNLFLRRRSSFPPANASQTSTPTSLAPEANLLDLFTSHTQQRSATTQNVKEGGMANQVPSLWNAFLNLAGDKQAVGMERRQSEPSAERRGSTSLRLPLPTKIAQYSSDLAWKTILGSVVEVDGVGDLTVSRVLQEIWARGGGDMVTAQSLWPAIIVSLSLPTEDHNVGNRVASPPPNAAAALQTLYTLTLRHWEPSIFAGLLSSFGQPGLPLPDIPLPSALESTPPVDSFGINTPVKGLDLSQWMNLTPGADWSFLAGTGLTPRRGSLAPSLPGPSSLAFELGELAPRDGADHSNSLRVEEDEADGLGELLAQMEEGREAAEYLSHLPNDSDKGNKPETSYLPTPETDNNSNDNDTPRDLTRQGSEGSRQGSFNPTPPESNEPTPPASYRASSSSITTATSTGISTPASSTSSGPLVKSERARPHPTALTMPTQTFIPPPPMCMFFAPTFHDLQNGKVGIWKGDLDVQGRGGGKFSVLIVGEAATGHVWQSHSWPTNITYPPVPQPNQSCTATMMPVAHLAREGFTPSAMGMVLCNDANISQFVEMVQGFHAEGVAFHLSTPGKLPIIFLPAKFSSEDPLQRLGIAFMTKPGIPLPPAPKSAAAATGGGHAGASEEPRRKRRRQSAPAQVSPPIPLPPHSASKSQSASAHKRRQTASIHTRSGGGTRLDRSVMEE